MSELLFCPFCGRQTYRKHDGGVWLTTTNHKRGCIMRDALAFVAFDTEAEAIAAWNARAERTCRMKPVYASNALECSECSSYVATWDAECDVCSINYCPNCGARVVER